jgi:glycosyltransferase involved in cell wall biosynthesis
MAAHNAGSYIHEAVESVLEQDYPALELVVVDDGSTDATPDILRSFGPSISCVRTECQGAPTARNIAYEKSRGDALIILDADDRLPKGAVRQQSTHLASVPSAHIVYADWSEIDPEGRELRVVTPPAALAPEADAYPAFVEHNLFAVHAAMFRREVVQSLGALHVPSLDVIPDWDFWAAAAVGHRFAYRPGVVAEYRIHPTMSLRRLNRARASAQTANTLLRILQRPAVQRAPRGVRYRAGVTLLVAAVRGRRRSLLLRSIAAVASQLLGDGHTAGGS